MVRFRLRPVAVTLVAAIGTLSALTSLADEQTLVEQYWYLASTDAAAEVVGVEWRNCQGTWELAGVRTNVVRIETGLCDGPRPHPW